MLRLAFFHRSLPDGEKIIIIKMFRNRSQIGISGNIRKPEKSHYPAPVRPRHACDSAVTRLPIPHQNVPCTARSVPFSPPGRVCCRSGFLRNQMNMKSHARTRSGTGTCASPSRCASTIVQLPSACPARIPERALVRRSDRDKVVPAVFHIEIVPPRGDSSSWDNTLARTSTPRRIDKSPDRSRDSRHDLERRQPE